jgi:formylglycine-generating enzyme required for sulfatase activity
MRLVGFLLCVAVPGFAFLQQGSAQDTKSPKKVAVPDDVAKQIKAFETDADSLHKKSESEVDAIHKKAGADADVIFKKADADIDTLRKKTDADIQARRAKLLEYLQAQQDASTKAGKLDEAVAIRDSIAAIKGEVEGGSLVIDLGKGVKMEFVRIRAGEFFMGSPDSDKDADADEKPQHKVKITKDFYLGKYPVTQEQYFLITGKNPSEFQVNSPHNSAIGTILRGVDTRKFPVERVLYDDAVEFCGALTRQFKQRGVFCLPTEAEWEYACRAGTTKRYVFSDEPTDLGLYAWYAQNSDGPPYRFGNRSVSGTHPVGTKKPNPWGLYDMQGSVWEWCADKFAAQRIGVNYYANSPLEDPKGPDTIPGLKLSGLQEQRVMRGNSWSAARGGPDMALDSRAAHRLGANPGQSDPRFGFRVCLRPGTGEEKK